MKRIYAIEVLKSADERLLFAYSKLNEYGEHGLKLKQLLLNKQLSDNLRRQMNINKLIGFAKKKDEDIIYILLYNVMVEEDNYYDQYLDKERNEIYIEVKETLEEI